MVDTTYTNGDDWGMVNMKLFYPHYTKWPTWYHAITYSWDLIETNDWGSMFWISPCDVMFLLLKAENLILAFTQLRPFEWSPQCFGTQKWPVSPIAASGKLPVGPGPYISSRVHNNEPLGSEDFLGTPVDSWTKLSGSLGAKTGWALHFVTTPIPAALADEVSAKHIKYI